MQLPKELKYLYVYNETLDKWVPLTLETVDDILLQLKKINLHLLAITHEEFIDGDTE